jgi:hypothetical protein
VLLLSVSVGSTEATWDQPASLSSDRRNREKALLYQDAAEETGLRMPPWNEEAGRTWRRETRQGGYLNGSSTPLVRAWT